MPESDAANARRRKIVQDAILQMRATGKMLGPEFLTRLKVIVRDFDPGHLVPDAEGAVSAHDGEGVDRRKNLLIVMKFLQMKDHDQATRRRILDLISENRTIQ